MKAEIAEVIAGLQADTLILLDIRFDEERQAWHFPASQHIPLPSLTTRHKELPKDRLIVTACPKKDRAIIAMLYLQSEGYRVKYLKDGLIALADALRGDAAREFTQALPKQ